MASGGDPQKLFGLLEQHLEKDPSLKILNMPFDVFREDVFKLLENMEA